MQQHCSVKDCGSPIYNKTNGWCRKHYLRWYKHGDPEYYSRFDVRKGIAKEDYILLPLNKEATQFTRVDKDSDAVNYNWCSDGEYAVRLYKGKPRAMHLIMFEGQVPKGMQIDHINRDKLDNRRANLRIVSRSLNQINKVMKNNKTGYRGVMLDKRANKWTAVVAFNRKKRIIYWGDSYEQAVEKRKVWEVEHGIALV